MEERLLRSGHELFRQMLEKGAQLKADPAPPICPVCQNKLSRWKPGHGTSIQTRFGTICIQRARGSCKRCREWRFPADAQLGLPAESRQSPAVREMAALTVGKMPAPEAQQVVERLAGVTISAATVGPTKSSSWPTAPPGFGTWPATALPERASTWTTTMSANISGRVAHALHPDDETAAQAWVDPMLDKLTCSFSRFVGTP